jgi:hypothetical protein
MAVLLILFILITVAVLGLIGLGLRALIKSRRRVTLVDVSAGRDS